VILRPSPYRAVNTPSLGYEKQSVSTAVQVNAVCFEICKNYTNTLCEQNVEFRNVKPGGTYSNHRALKG
jgi:hypothetical protein